MIAGPDEIDADVLVIGGGVVGLACAAVLARRGGGRVKVILVERHARPGQETSSRNSGVVHAGLYDPPGSRKARLCVRGRALLEARCARESIGYRRTGKLLVATDEEEAARLAEIHARGLVNGAGALQFLGASEVAALEPHVRARAGLLSPETGIVDVHGLMESYLAEARAAGATIALRTEVIGLARDPAAATGWTVETRAGAGAEAGDGFALRARAVVNAAGLDADRVAARAGLDVDARGLRQRPCKGDYFRLAPRLRGIVSRLVYPVPVHAGLGVHVTLDLAGALRAGPDATYVEAPRYDVDPAKAARFGAALRRYLPAVADEDLAPDYAGVRPKLRGPADPFRDFVIEEAAEAPGLVNLVGIESPGLTASEAIAEEVAALVLG